ncbi:MAG: hypothetical protein IT381_30155 [Deltaproteobacteria bacterium]|nr:hypothetical protein [Deltaproteobacteria bacterium]
MKPKIRKTATKPRTLLVKLTPDDGARVDAIVSRVPEFASHTGVVTRAMRIGLAALEADPSFLIMSSDEIAKALKARA